MAKALNDGYTRPGYIRAFPGFHPAVRLDYRRASLEEQMLWTSKYDVGEPADRIEFATEFIARKLVKWDLKDKNGRLVPLNADSLKDQDLTDPTLFARLAAIVLGWQLPDKLPDAKKDDVAEQEAIKAEAKEAGLTPGDVQEGREAKNS